MLKERIPGKEIASTKAHKTHMALQCFWRIKRGRAEAGTLPNRN